MGVDFEIKGLSYTKSEIIVDTHNSLCYSNQALKDSSPEVSKMLAGAKAEIVNS
ncbi:hypothetical protein ACHOLT_03050 [Desulfitobacterium sp. Sab5]|uniref:hypothetical protein n=1 Tax=Desulfitobacterium nosdiversum TaxID=3375356 RepID=UPI003CEEFFA9